MKKVGELVQFLLGNGFFLLNLKLFYYDQELNMMFLRVIINFFIKGVIVEVEIIEQKELSIMQFNLFFIV